LTTSSLIEGSLKFGGPKREYRRGREGGQDETCGA